MCYERRGLICLSAILIILTCFYPPSMVKACDCGVPKNANEAMDRAAAVFRGEVLQIKTDESSYVALISVLEIWKGIEESQVLIYTDKNSSCRFDFEVGKEYLLYPYEQNGKLKVINCGRNAEINNEMQDLMELGKGYEPIKSVHLKDEFKNSNSFMIISGVLALFVIVTIIIFRKKQKKN